jgi:flavin-dependent dehydrogenase
VDVAVIGGSAAGFLTAFLLARGGRSVQVVERASGIDTAPRTLIVTSRMADMLGDLGDKAVVNRIYRFELCADGRVATVTLRQPDLVVERSILIRTLAEHAEAAGAEIVLGRQLVQIAPNGHGLTFIVDAGGGGQTEQRWARALVGADGAFSTVARAIGSPQPATVPLLQAIVPLPADLSPDTTRVWFEPADTPYFYWLIPESPTRGVLGLIGEEGRETRRCLERFLARQRLEPIEFQAARIPAYAGWIPNHRRLGHGDVYLVGDAAGQV